jgi:hypothetical protein
MEISYTMIGGDGSHYGPVPLEQFRAWIAEGRVLPETKIRRSDTNSWLPASQYTELGLSGGSTTAAATAATQAAPPFPMPPAPAMAMPDLMLERRVKQSANWFYWIAALSLVNTTIMYTGGGIRFAVGLAMNTKIAMFAYQMDWPRDAVIGLEVLVAGIFALFGLFAGMRQDWAFIVGMILYAIDGVLCLTTMGSLMMVGFHAFVLYAIFKGLQANLLLHRMKR